VSEISASGLTLRSIRGTVSGSPEMSVFVANSGTSDSRKAPLITLSVLRSLLGAVGTSTTAKTTSTTSASGAWIHASSAIRT